MKINNRYFEIHVIYLKRVLPCIKSNLKDKMKRYLKYKNNKLEKFNTQNKLILPKL